MLGLALLPLIISSVFAAEDIRNIVEKTYTRDNTHCEYGREERVQFQIRGANEKTEPQEKKYGEYVVYYPNIKPKLLPLNQDRLGNYRLFEGYGTLCSKSYSIRLKKDLAAMLFLLDNAPFQDKLTIVIFNTSSMESEKIIETPYLVDQVQPFEGGFFFNSHPERQNLQMGKVMIQGQNMLWQDRDFVPWYKFTLEETKISPSETFKNLKYKKFFKDEKEFLTLSGWSDKSGRFERSSIFFASNPQQSFQCLMLTQENTKPTGQEKEWICQSRK